MPVSSIDSPRSKERDVRSTYERVRDSFDKIFFTDTYVERTEANDEFTASFVKSLDPKQYEAWLNADPKSQLKIIEGQKVLDKYELKNFDRYSQLTSNLYPDYLDPNKPEEVRFDKLRSSGKDREIVDAGRDEWYRVMYGQAKEVAATHIGAPVLREPQMERRSIGFGFMIDKMKGYAVELFGRQNRPEFDDYLGRLVTDLNDKEYEKWSVANREDQFKYTELHMLKDSGKYVEQIRDYIAGDEKKRGEILSAIFRKNKNDYDTVREGMGAYERIFEKEIISEQAGEVLLRGLVQRKVRSSHLLPEIFRYVSMKMPSGKDLVNMLYNIGRSYKHAFDMPKETRSEFARKYKKFKDFFSAKLNPENPNYEAELRHVYGSKKAVKPHVTKKTGKPMSVEIEETAEGPKIHPLPVVAAAAAGGEGEGGGGGTTPTGEFPRPPSGGPGGGTPEGPDDGTPEGGTPFGPNWGDRIGSAFGQVWSAIAAGAIGFGRGLYPFVFRKTYVREGLRNHRNWMQANLIIPQVANVNVEAAMRYVASVDLAASELEKDYFGRNGFYADEYAALMYRNSRELESQVANVVTRLGATARNNELMDLYRPHINALIQNSRKHSRL